jgi:hypothetical protein
MLPRSGCNYPDRGGYLFVRGLLPAGPIEALHARFADIARNAGWIDGRGRALPGAARGEVDPEYQAVYRRMFHVEEFHRLLHQRAQVALFRRLLDGPVLPHPRGIIRAMFPSTTPSTAPHQDFYYVQGSPLAYTLWVPLMRCPRAMGSLEVAVGSHRQGLYPTGDDLGPGGAEATRSLAAHWRGADFEVGDALIFHSMTVHRAGPNRTDDLRLSVDFRYQSRTEEICGTSMLLPAFLVDDASREPWADIYAGWTSRDLCYYWKRWHLRWSELDPALMREVESRALEVAERGEPHARQLLVRIAKIDPEPTRRARAIHLLQALAAEGHAGIPTGLPTTG